MADGFYLVFTASDDGPPCIKLTVTLTVASWKLDIVIKVLLITVSVLLILYCSSNIVLFLHCSSYNCISCSSI